MDAHYKTALRPNFSEDCLAAYFKGSPMKTSKVIGLIFAIVTVAPPAQAARLTFDFDAFIPTKRVTNPAAELLPPFFTEFKGDDRDFSLEATRNGQARLFSQVVLDTDSPDLIASSFAEAGTSVGYLEENGIEVSQSDRTTPISSFAATRVSDRNIKLEVAVRGTNPLIDKFLPPDVENTPAEFIYNIDLTLSDDGIDYELAGTNRAYPSYSVFLNGEPILLNPANDVDNPELLGVIEPVEARGTVAVDEPVGLLGLGLLAIAGLLGQITGKRTAPKM